MRAQQHRHPERAGLDEILPAIGQQAAADKSHITGAKIRRHLTHAVAKDKGAIGRNIAIFAAQYKGVSARLE